MKDKYFDLLLSEYENFRDQYNQSKTSEADEALYQMMERLKDLILFIMRSKQ